jgi:hypothetical protein
MHATRKGSIVRYIYVNQAFCFLIVEALGRDRGRDNVQQMVALEMSSIPKQ